MRNQSAVMLVMFFKSFFFHEKYIHANVKIHQLSLISIVYYLLNVREKS